MLKSALGAVAALLTFGGAGMAGEIFVNPELNTGFGTDSGFGAAIVEEQSIVTGKLKKTE
jgi:hypothetical protein